MSESLDVLNELSRAETSADEMKAIVNAFQMFQERASSLAETYERLQSEVHRLNEELERKNAELEQKSQLIEGFQLFEEQWRSLEGSNARLQRTVDRLTDDLEQENLKLEASLQEQQRLHHSLRSIVNSLHYHGVIAVDLDGRVTLFNRHASEMTGVAEEDAMGRLYAEVFPNHPPILMKTLADARPQARREFEDYLGNANDADRRQIEVTTALVRDDDGALHGAVEALYDRTDFREMESQLERAKVLAALGEVSVAIAHEIRNPLGAIQLFAETLRDGALDADERDRVYDNIFAGIKVMNNTISNLLQFTRPVLTSEEFQDLSPLLDQALALAEHAIRANHVSVLRDYPPIGLMCHADESQIVKALLNLILNAVHATEGRAKREMRVVARRSDESGEDSSATDLFDGAPWIDIKIEDNGCGIPEDMLERIFTPFVTTKDNGVGLGLSIVHKVVEAHGGKINVDSVVDQGASVRMILPVYRPGGPA